MRVTRDPAVLASYLGDASNVPARAEALVRARSAEEVAEVVSWCQSRSVPLTVVGGRTSTVGGAAPEGGWLLSLEQMRDILEISTEEAVAEAGVHLGELDRRLAPQDLFYPPDPTSLEDCTIGGSLATNASGARSFRFGPTRRWVLEVDAVLPTGELVRVDRSTPLPSGQAPPSWRPPPVKHAGGYHPSWRLLDVLIGSEGTLGVITRARLRLQPRPQDTLGIMAFFPSSADCLDFVEPLRGERDTPTGPWCIEYLDRACLELLPQLAAPRAAGAALYLEVPHHGPPPVERWLERLCSSSALLDDTLATTSPDQTARIRAARRAIPETMNEEAARRGMPKVGTDLAVPAGAIRKMMDEYERVPLPSCCFGHLGDCHLHLNLLPTSPRELERARELALHLAHRAVELGGTVSAEHGLGKTRRHLLPLLAPPEVMNAFRRLKMAADPNQVLGRGNLLAPPGA